MDTRSFQLASVDTLADPWFNYRAAEYLVENGWHAFFHWFDHSAWYPLGRPIATTIYPALQVTAAAIHSMLQAAGQSWTLAEVCCYIPVWFGMSATMFTGLLTYECSGGSLAAGAGGAVVMAILPAHLSRSVGGGFDNESVAITALCATCYFWCRALRKSSAQHGTYAFGLLSGASYSFMAMAWGGYVFCVNTVSCGHYSSPALR
jgi:dolichyl-diphosphooligosaccharide--protein glycosyltransferase